MIGRLVQVKNSLKYENDKIWKKVPQQEFLIIQKWGSSRRLFGGVVVKFQHGRLVELVSCSF